jgi:hypothetical protein
MHAHAYVRKREWECTCPSVIHQHMGLCLLPQWIGFLMKFHIKNSAGGHITFIVFKCLLWNVESDSLHKMAAILGNIKVH